MSTPRSRSKPDTSIALTRREREILDVVYRLGEANVGQIRAKVPNAPHYSTVRSLLRVLEEKGHVSHSERNLRYLYKPVVPKAEAAQFAIDRLLTTFFDGSAENLLVALLPNMSPEQVDRAFRVVLDK